MTQPATSPAVAGAIAQIEHSWDRFQAELDQIPRDRLLEPGAVGVWSVKDLLGHIAYWDEQAVPVGRRHLAGTPEPDFDVDVINAREAARRADRTLDEQRTEMNQAHQAMLDYIRSQAEDESAALGLCGCLQGYTYAHYDTHTADLRSWRDRIDL